MSVPVIAISGFPGSGKTTLTRRLAAYYGVPALFYDDHEQVTSRPPDEIRDWIARGSDYDEIDLASLLAAIDEAAAAAPPFILLDTLLGRAHAATNARIGLSLWLDVPADVALARKFAQSARRVAGPGELADFAQWVASYAGHYEDFIAGTYRVQAERVRTRADACLEQWGDGEALLHEAVAAIASSGIETVARPSLIAAMERFGAGFGFEQSIKISAGQVNDDRYITSVHRDDLGMEPRDAISSVISAEGLPEEYWSEIMRLLPTADIIHFGHEGGTDPVRKIYLEFVETMHAAARAGKRDPILLYLALKWRPGQERRAAFNRYILAPDNQIPPRMIETLRKGYAGRGDAISLWLGVETIRLAASRARQKGLLFAEVEEEGTGRYSYDIAIYNAQVFGREMAHYFAPMFKAYGIAADQAASIQKRIDGKQIGHISVGIGRDGGDFVTIYYGVETRKPASHG